jgi:hypothetical protein
MDRLEALLLAELHRPRGGAGWKLIRGFALSFRAPFRDSFKHRAR